MAALALHRAAALILVAFGTASHAQVSFRGLGTLTSDQHSFVAGISPDGSLPLGRAMAYNADGSTSGRAVRWTGAGIEILESTPPYWDASAGAASNGGQVAVGYGQIGNGGPGTTTRAFRTIGGITTHLPGFQPADITAARDITPDGSIIVGSSGVVPCTWTGDGFPVSLPVTDDAVAAGASSISADGSRLVGTFRRASNTLGAYLWIDRQTPQEIPLPISQPQNVSLQISLDGRTVIGTAFQSVSPTAIGFTWSQSGGLAPLPAGFSPLACSADASLIGGLTLSQHATLLRDGQLIDVESLLTSLGIDHAGWSLTSVNAISADGLTIGGTGRHRYGANPGDIRTEGWVAVIPGPSGIAVFIGIGVPVLSSRRRNASRGLETV